MFRASVAAPEQSRHPLLSVEQIAKEPAAAAAMPAIIAIITTTVATLVMVATAGGIAARLDDLLQRGRTRLIGSAPFDDLVEFATIEPDTPASRAIVDLDALAIRHDEIDPTVGHNMPAALGRGAVVGVSDME